MRKAPIHQQSLLSLSESLNTGSVTAREISDAFLERIARFDPEIGSVNSIDPDRIRAAAEASDLRRSRGQELSPVDGLPVGMKDVIAVESEWLTCSSRMLANFTSPYDATVTRKLKAAGMIPFGRLNMDEFAMGSSNENSATRNCHNPWDVDRAPGGSSGGAAAAVAAGFCPAALGSDTGGSIRQPAAFCGIYGFKPTYGRVSRFGLVAFASSLDQIGPMARTVGDLALLTDLITGKDPLDTTSAPEDPTQCVAALQQSEMPKKIGIPKEAIIEGMDPEVQASFDKVIRQLESMGSECVRISLPHTEYAVPTYYIAATAEASSNLSRYDGVRYGHRSERSGDAVDLHFHSRGEGFGPEVKRRIILGTYVLSSGFYDAYYKRAQQVRQKIRMDYTAAFQEVDLILSPTTPTPAFRLGEKQSNPLEMYLADIFTIAVNLAGLPALSLPCSLSSEGLPIGFQLIGKPMGEEPLLSAAAAYEKTHPFPYLSPFALRS